MYPSAGRSTQPLPPIQPVVPAQRESCLHMIGRMIIWTIRWLLNTAGIFYTLGVLGMIALWAVLPGYRWWLDMTAIFAAYLFLPVIGMLVMAFLIRSYALLSASLILGVVFGLQFGPMLTPTLNQPDVAPNMRVVTFNKLYNNSDPMGTINALADQNADIVAVQELTPPSAQALEQQLADMYPYRTFTAEALASDVGLLSRYPLEAVEQRASFNGVRAVVNVDGQPITILNVHPVPPIGPGRTLPIPLIDRQVSLPTFAPQTRDEQLRALLDEIGRTDGPLIVAGDLNLSPREPLYTRFDALMRDAYDEVGWGFGHTFPNYRGWRRALPRVRIDYILSSDDLVPVDARVNCTVAASDHCMVIADLGR